MITRLSGACRDGNLEIVIAELEAGADPAFDYNLPIQLAAENGHFQVVEYLLGDPRVNPADYNNYAIRIASENGCFQAVACLLNDSRVDSSVYDNYAIKIAAKRVGTTKLSPPFLPTIKNIILNVLMSCEKMKIYQHA